MKEQVPFERTSVVRNTALMLAIIILIGLTLRALVAREIEPIATGSGLASALLLFLVYRHVKRGGSAESGAVAVLGIAIALYTALSWASGGFRGSVIFAAPMVPLIASLLLGKRAVRNITIIMAAVLLFILVQHLAGVLQPEERYPEEIRYVMHAIVLLLSLVAVNWISSFYTAMGMDVPAPGKDDGRDSLTGLLRRGMINEALGREFARARRAESQFSFAIAEVDKYAALEAEYGPQGAENCLIGVADALRYCMRRSSDALGRFAPDRLCILMVDTPGSGAAVVGEKFRELIATLDIPVHPDRTIRLTVSIGVCAAHARGLANVEAVVTGAEEALAQASRGGGNVTEVTELSESGEKVS